jgi:branched-chain amino acid transport system substrate-binding protein
MTQAVKVWASALTVAAVVTMTACSSSSKSANTTPTSSTGSSTGSSASATAAPIKVGMVCACSGPFGSSFEPQEETYTAWVKSTNSSGGLNGHPIQLITENDGGVPGTSVTDAQTLISDHVDAIVVLTVLDEAWASAVKSAGIPVVGGNVTESTFFTNTDFYPEGQTTDDGTYSWVETAKTAGATNIAFLYCAESPSCAEGVPLIKKVGAAVGVPDIYNAEIAGTAPNYTAQCLAAKQAGVTSINIGQSGAVAARVTENCSVQGYYPIYAQGGEAWDNTLASAQGMKQNSWWAFEDLPYWASGPEVDAMNTAVDKYYPGLRTSSNWNEGAAETWASGILLRDAVKAGGLTASATPSPAEIAQGLDSLKGDTLDGWSPPLTFHAGQLHIVDCWFTARLQNGTPSLTNGGRVTCGNLPPSS